MFCEFASCHKIVVSPKIVLRLSCEFGLRLISTAVVVLCHCRQRRLLSGSYSSAPTSNFTAMSASSVSRDGEAHLRLGSMSRMDTARLPGRLPPVPGALRHGWRRRVVRRRPEWAVCGRDAGLSVPFTAAVDSWSAEQRSTLVPGLTAQR